MDRIISEIKNTANKVMKKSSEIVEISKIKFSIANLKSDINAKFKELGELVYLSQKSDEEPDTNKLEELLSSIDGLYARLNELTEISSSLKKEKLCPICSKANAMDSQFCSGCGHKFAECGFDDSETEEEVITEVDVL